MSWACPIVYWNIQFDLKQSTCRNVGSENGTVLEFRDLRVILNAGYHKRMGSLKTFFHHCMFPSHTNRSASVEVTVYYLHREVCSLYFIHFLALTQGPTPDLHQYLGQGQGTRSNLLYLWNPMFLMAGEPEHTEETCGKGAFSCRVNLSQVMSRALLCNPFSLYWHSLSCFSSAVRLLVLML